MWAASTKNDSNNNNNNNDNDNDNDNNNNNNDNDNILQSGPPVTSFKLDAHNSIIIGGFNASYPCVFGQWHGAPCHSIYNASGRAGALSTMLLSASDMFNDVSCMKLVNWKSWSHGIYTHIYIYVCAIHIYLYIFKDIYTVQDTNII